VKRAYRSDTKISTVDSYKESFKKQIERHRDPLRAVRHLVVQTFISPRFLFRIERSNVRKPQTLVRDVELANRLSYFLWSSMPDKELMELAESKKLQNESVLIQQTKRMLSDPRAQSLVNGFGQQWLKLRDYEGNVSADTEVFPQYNEELKEAMFQESIAFF
jgi:hypothetical protein